MEAAALGAQGRRGGHWWKGGVLGMLRGVVIGRVVVLVVVVMDEWVTDPAKP